WLVSHEAKLLKGLYSFPLVEFNPLSDSKKQIEEKVRDAFGVRIKISSEAGRVQHDYTHFRQIAVLFDAELAGNAQKANWVSQEKMRALPLAKLQHKLSAL
ncbi:MAG: NUDIX domain-containing protein, partial [Candidatus Diapherotrites archaeon]|nr:NUDIX domain-containing protein [Candidatus Diapherotrites archaeon]